MKKERGKTLGTLLIGGTYQRRKFYCHAEINVNRTTCIAVDTKGKDKNAFQFQISNNIN